MPAAAARSGRRFAAAAQVGTGSDSRGRSSHLPRSRGRNRRRGRPRGSRAHLALHLDYTKQKRAACREQVWARQLQNPTRFEKPSHSAFSSNVSASSCAFSSTSTATSTVTMKIGNCTRFTSLFPRGTHRDPVQHSGGDRTLPSPRRTHRSQPTLNEARAGLWVAAVSGGTAQAAAT